SAPKFRITCSIASIRSPRLARESMRAGRGRFCARLLSARYLRTQPIETTTSSEDACPSSAEAPDFIFALCWKDFLPVRSALKICATDYAHAAKRGANHLHRILRRLDTLAAERIHANDVPKVIRAIEVCLTSRQASRSTSRQTMTELWQQGREPLRGFRILRLGLNPEREVLYSRINQRAVKMFDEGLVGE